MFVKDTGEGFRLIDDSIPSGLAGFMFTHTEIPIWFNEYETGRFLRIDPMISGSNPTSPKLSLRVGRVASSLIPSVGITSCCHTERKDLNTPL